MPKRKLNPIAEHIEALVESEETTLEKISVVSDIPYPTLRNIFTRPRVSELTLIKLQASGIINDDLVLTYQDWMRENSVPRKRRRRKRRVEPKKRPDFVEPREETLD